ncbi:MAG: EAL domain-containing protein [Pseudomonadota bacterium]
MSAEPRAGTGCEERAAPPFVPAPGVRAGTSLGGAAFRSALPADWSDPLDTPGEAEALAPSGHGLILLAIDDFAAIGGFLGEDVAVALAYAAEERLWPALPEGAGSWPAGRGEFAIVLPDITPEGLLDLARQLQARLAQTPLLAPSGEVQLTASAGCALAVPSRLRHLGESANRALAAARRRGRGRAEIVPAAADRREDILRTAQRLLAAGALSLDFQPILPLGSPARPIGADAGLERRPPLYTECLIRMPMAPGAPLLPAAAFLPGLLAAGEARAVDRYVLERALDHLRESPRLRLGINVAAETLNDADWHSLLAAAARTPSPPTERLVVEIAAATLAEDPVNTGVFAERVRRSGAALAIDNYVPGALDQPLLESLRPDVVKAAIRRGASTPLLKPLLTLAARRDMTVVATRLETSEAIDEARAMGMCFGQGIALAAPAQALPDASTPAIRSVRERALRYGSASR